MVPKVCLNEAERWRCCCCEMWKWAVTHTTPPRITGFKSAQYHTSGKNGSMKTQSGWFLDLRGWCALVSNSLFYVYLQHAAADIHWWVKMQKTEMNKVRFISEYLPQKCFTHSRLRTPFFLSQSFCLSSSNSFHSLHLVLMYISWHLSFVMGLESDVLKNETLWISDYTVRQHNEDKELKARTQALLSSSPNNGVV